MTTDDPEQQLDIALEEVVATLREADPSGERIAEVLRGTFDQLYDGSRTGRYRWDQLFKTEKTHCGTLVEINLQRKFKFADGLKLDYNIAGHEVDAKYSQRLGGWMLPPEAVGELCLVVTADDLKSTFSIGIVRADPNILSEGSNRDAKRTLVAKQRDRIVWLFKDADLPKNILLHMSAEDIAAVTKPRGGTAKVVELFRRTTGQVVNRSAIETLSKQLDVTRRVRGGDGGARDPLAAQGIAVLGGAYGWHRRAARDLGVPVPRRTEYVSGYVAPADDDWRGPSVLGAEGLRLRAATAADCAPFPPRWYPKQNGSSA